MKAEEMHVMVDINKHREQENISIGKVAKAMMLDTSSCSRQIKEEHGGVNLNTAYRYAEFFNGRVIFVPDAQFEEWQKVDEYKAEIAALQARVSALNEARDELDKQLTNLSEILASQRERLDATAEQMKMKDAQIDTLWKDVREERADSRRKDAMLNKLLAEKGVI